MSLELNCANFVDEGKGLTIPPKNGRKYSVDIRAKSLKSFIQRGGEVVVIPVEKTREIAGIEHDEK